MTKQAMMISANTAAPPAEIPMMTGNESGEDFLSLLEEPLPAGLLEVAVVSACFEPDPTGGVDSVVFG
jgi:hypothetical protein